MHLRFVMYEGGRAYGPPGHLVKKMVRAWAELHGVYLEENYVNATYNFVHHFYDINLYTGLVNGISLQMRNKVDRIFQLLDSQDLAYEVQGGSREPRKIYTNVEDCGYAGARIWIEAEDRCERKRKKMRPQEDKGPDPFAMPEVIEVPPVVHASLSALKSQQMLTNYLFPVRAIDVKKELALEEQMMKDFVVKERLCVDSGGQLQKVVVKGKGGQHAATVH